MDALGSIHTIGGLEECSFESVSSSYSDMAFDIEYTGDEGQVFKWRWETNFEGYKSSSQLLSQHLILPLLTLSHMSLSNDDDEDAKDIEKAVDKACRTARRALPIHLKNVFKAKLSTTLCRVTAATNFVPDSQLPPVSLASESPEITLPTPVLEDDEEKQPTTKSSPPPSPPSTCKAVPHPPSPEKATSAVTSRERERSPTPARMQSPSQAPMDVDDDSATESEEEEIDLSQVSRRAPPSQSQSSVPKPSIAKPAPPPPSPPPTVKNTSPRADNIDQKVPSPSPSPPPTKATRSKPSSASSSELKKLTKRAKPAISDSDDSGEEHGSSGTRGGAPKARGTRQPLRRGGKRF